MFILVLIASIIAVGKSFSDQLEKQMMERILELSIQLRPTKSHVVTSGKCKFGLNSRGSAYFISNGL